MHRSGSVNRSLDDFSVVLPAASVSPSPVKGSSIHRSYSAEEAWRAGFRRKYIRQFVSVLRHGRIERVTSVLARSRAVKLAADLSLALTARRRNTWYDSVSAPPVFAQTAASRFAQASAVDKVSSGRWQSRRPAGVEHNSEQFSHYHQHLDSGKVGLDSRHLTYGLSEGNNVGRRAKTPTNVEQNTYNEKEKYGFDDCGRNNYRDASAHTARDLPAGLARNIAAEPCLRNKDDSRSVFAETNRANSGDFAHTKLGRDVEYSGCGDVSRNNVEGYVDLDKNEITSLGNTVPRQVSPVTDLTEEGAVRNAYCTKYQGYFDMHALSCETLQKRRFVALALRRRLGFSFGGIIAK